MDKDTNKNLKDSATHTDISIMDTSFSISYTKSHKLITALYMVTDIIDKDEPIRVKLRTLGTEIISDMHSVPAGAAKKVSEVMSFLSIASAMNFISEMNYAILKKELLELKAAIHAHVEAKPKLLSEFFLQPHSTLEESNFNAKQSLSDTLNQNKGHVENYNGQSSGNRIGVQKGSTLMKALKRFEIMKPLPDKKPVSSTNNAFDILKKQRRNDIINIIKILGGNATIKDIRTKINTGISESLAYSEKTLQRELMSMIKDDVLFKTGEKRWSRYFVKN